MTAVPMHQVFDYIPFHERSSKNSALAEEVYEHILREIVFPGEDPKTQIHYGGKITESVVAKELQVSNGPVREAFYRLRQESWIYTDRNRGSFLVDFSDPQIAMDIYRFRVTFETGSFYALASHITDNQKAQLEKIIDRMDEAIRQSDINTFRREDINFIWPSMRWPAVLIMFVSIVPNSCNGTPWPIMYLFDQWELNNTAKCLKRPACPPIVNCMMPWPDATVMKRLR